MIIARPPSRSTRWPPPARSSSAACTWSPPRRSRRDPEELDTRGGEADPLAGRRARLQGLRGFPGSICASPNSMVVHGIPGHYELQARRRALGRRRRDQGRLGRRRGDDGPDRPDRPEARKLLDVTKASLFAGIEQMQPGNRLGDVSAAIRGRSRPRASRSSAPWSATGSAARCTRSRRSPLRRARQGAAAGGGNGAGDRADGQRRRTAGADGGRRLGGLLQDGSLAAHFEFTVAITADGPGS